MNAARIVAGLPIFASLQSMYLETGWESIVERRRIKKLTLTYKNINKEPPDYLFEMLKNCR